MANPPPLDKARHLKYWTRCVRSPLPHQYISMDSTRCTLGFFILGAIDILTTPSELPDSPEPLPSPLTPANLSTYRSWVLSCTHPSGGFCGSPNMVPPKVAADDYDAFEHSSIPGAPESANLGATFFALLLLALTSQDSPSTAFSRVDRRGVLRWLRKLQRPDGSFGEVVDADGIICGGKDMRYCYLAAAVRWYLRDPNASPEEDAELDFNTEQLIEYIRAGQGFDGGVAESEYHESHAGYSYCAVAALSLLDRPATGQANHPSKALDRGIRDKETFVKCCLSRQFTYLEAGDEALGNGEDMDGDEDEENFRLPKDLAALSLDGSIPHIAFNGRCNKVADTCYAWWVGGALSLMSRLDLVRPSTDATRAFLMEKMQHMIGGFSKHPGGPPDIYHSYLGLAALATLDRTADRLPPFDEALCVSTTTVGRIEKAREGMLKREREYGDGKDNGKVGGVLGKLLEMGEEMVKVKKDVVVN